MYTFMSGIIYQLNKFFLSFYDDTIKTFFEAKYFTVFSLEHRLYLKKLQVAMQIPYSFKHALHCSIIEDTWLHSIQLLVMSFHMQ